MPSVRIEVVYALPQRQTSVSLELDEGATVRNCVDTSGILKTHPEIDLGSADVGIWSERVSLDHLVCDGDRIEIYRPLIADPKVIRRQQARQRK